MQTAWKESTFEKLLGAVKRNMLQLVQVIIFSSRLPSSSCLLPSYMHIYIIVNFKKTYPWMCSLCRVLTTSSFPSMNNKRDRKEDSYTKKLILSFMWLWYDSQRQQSPNHSCWQLHFLKLNHNLIVSLDFVISQINKKDVSMYCNWLIIQILIKYKHICFCRFVRKIR